MVGPHPGTPLERGANGFRAGFKSLFLRPNWQGGGSIGAASWRGGSLIRTAMASVAVAPCRATGSASSGSRLLRRTSIGAHAGHNWSELGTWVGTIAAMGWATFPKRVRSRTWPGHGGRENRLRRPVRCDRVAGVPVSAPLAWRLPYLRTARHGIETDESPSQEDLPYLTLHLDTAPWKRPPPGGRFHWCRRRPCRDPTCRCLFIRQCPALHRRPDRLRRLGRCRRCAAVPTPWPPRSA